MPQGARTLHIDNNGPAKSFGTVKFLEESLITDNDTITLNDGTQVHVIVFEDAIGVTDATTVYYKLLTTMELAAAYTEAVELARAAGSIDIGASVEGNTVHLLHTSDGANNVAMLTTIDTLAAGVQGMDGGSDDVGAPRFTRIDFTDVNHANHAQATLIHLKLYNKCLGVLRYGWDSTADPTAGVGSWVTLGPAEEVHLDFRPELGVSHIYVNGAMLGFIEYTYEYTHTS